MILLIDFQQKKMRKLFNTFSKSGLFKYKREREREGERERERERKTDWERYRHTSSEVSHYNNIVIL